ncbi:MAG: 30S ribosomal protein S6, partial [Rubripirellula sp.]|nr:30S ribosomal protein S6 [Rubripirellula sp.]
YWLAYYEIEGVKIPAIDRALQLAESVIRHLTVKLEPRLVEPILANARGESIKMSTPTDSSTDEAEDGTEVAAEVAADA